MASELTDLIVTPLREYGRKLYKETGRRVRLEVTIDGELFDRLLAEAFEGREARSPVVFFENSVQIVVVRAEPPPLWSGCPFCNAPRDRPHTASCRHPENDAKERTEFTFTVITFNEPDLLGDSIDPTALTGDNKPTT